MVLNPRAERWTGISVAEHRGTCQPAGWLNHAFSFRFGAKAKED
jgi:hypothetical protein